MPTWSFLSSIGVWEFLEYAFECAVIVGCAGEALGEFTNFLNVRNDGTRKDRLLKASTIILIFGLAGSLISTVRTNALAGEAINELDERLAWRDISPRQRSEIVNALRTFPGQSTHITFRMLDPEAARLSGQLAQILNAANWKTSFGTPNPSVSIEAGISIGSTSDEPSRNAAIALARELRARNLTVGPLWMHKTWPTPLVIIDVRLNPALMPKPATDMR